MKSKDDNEHLVAILCYFIIGIVWYFADEKVKKSSLVRFHAKQALNLFIISLIIQVIGSVIPFFGWVILTVASIAMLILWIIGLINAVNNEKKLIPIIGEFADKYLKF